MDGSACPLVAFDLMNVDAVSAGVGFLSGNCAHNKFWHDASDDLIDADNRKLQDDAGGWSCPKYK
jgi:hypothetical protein